VTSEIEPSAGKWEEGCAEQSQGSRVAEAGWRLSDTGDKEANRYKVVAEFATITPPTDIWLNLEDAFARLVGFFSQPLTTSRHTDGEVDLSTASVPRTGSKSRIFCRYEGTAMHQQPALPDVPGLSQLFIGGRWREPASAGRAKVVCPANEEVVAEVAMPSIADADAAVRAAREAFDAGPWPRMSIADRAGACARLADELEKRLHRMNIAWMLEAGAPLAHSEMINSGAGPMIWRNAIDLAPRLSLEERRSGKSGEVLLLRDPVGVVLAILTYNGPVVLMGMKAFQLCWRARLSSPAPEFH
jgi:hypothetical protein